MKPKIPHTPKAWYHIGVSKDFCSRPKAVSILGKDIVVYRKKDGSLAALHRFCCHMGADLALGKVVDDQIVCHFHNWTFNDNGSCVRIPQSNGKRIPDFARLRAFPITERHGLVFLFNGKKPDYPLPFFNDQNPDKFIHSRMVEVLQKTDWYVVPANAFDMAHFIYVHRRIPLKDPQLLSPNSFCRRIIINYEVRGQSWIDKMVTRVFGKSAQLDFTSWSGNFLLAETTIGSMTNRMLILVEQKADALSVAKIFVYADHTKSRWPLKLFLPVRLWLQAKVSQRFFQQEGDLSEGVHIDLSTLGPNDDLVKDYIQWLVDLHGNNQSEAKNNEVSI